MDKIIPSKQKIGELGHLSPREKIYRKVTLKKYSDTKFD